MKRSIVFILLIIMILVFASCTITVNVPGQTNPSEKPSVSPQASRYAGPSVISSSGAVAGGYANGQWLTSSEAAQLCGSPLKFYAYKLTGPAGTVDTTGMTIYEDDGPYFYSWVSGMGEEDEVDMYSLLPEEMFEPGEYEADPLSCVYYYTTPPESLPEITVVSDMSAILPVIQQKIDENLGAGKAAALIRSAVSADIDSDGQTETIVNADNCADKMYDEVQNLYTIACIIESDGRVVIAAEFYVPESIEEYQEPVLIYIQNLIDLDGDGLCEIVLDNSAWESWWMDVYKYDGTGLTKVLTYGAGV